MSRPQALVEPPTRLPPALRRWLGARLMGPPRGMRQRQHRACLFAPGRTGDFVLALSALRLLAREAGTGRCTLVTRPELAALAAVELPGVEVIALPGEAAGLLRDILPAWWRERPKLAAHRFETKIAFSHYRSFFQEIVFSWIDADRSIGLTDATYPAAPADGQGTELPAHRMVASAALGRGVTPAEIEPRFASFPCRDDGRLLVYPLSRDPARSLAAGRVAGILAHGRGPDTAPVVLGGHPDDVATLRGYADAMRAAGIARVAVETPAGIPALVNHIAAAGAVLATDSAAAHIAIACDKPAAIVIPPVLRGLALPWQRSSRQRLFSSESPDAGIAAALAAP